MTLPRSAADVLAGHVLFEIEAIDRMYLNLYQPRLQHGAGIAAFFVLGQERLFPVAPGLGGVGADRPEQGDPVVVAGGEDVPGADVAGVDRVLAGSQAPGGQALVDDLGHLGIARGRVAGLHVRDQVRQVRLAGLGQVDLVPGPSGPALDAVAGVGVVGGGEPLFTWREVLALPPAHLLPVPAVLLLPGPAQGLDCGDLPQPLRGAWRAGGVQQREAVPADLPEPPASGVFPLGEAVRVDPAAVALDP